MAYPPKRKKRRLSPLEIAVPILSVILIGLIVLVICLPDSQPNTPSTHLESSSSSQTSSLDTPPVDVPPDPPPIVKTSTATISAVGDMLMHMPVISTGAQGDGSYDFASIFRYFSDYIQSADYAVGNLETTLAGTQNGFPYSGYPNFNCPDGIIDSMKTAGFDGILTANNHSYDTKSVGFRRTYQTISQRNLDIFGTKGNADDPNFLIAQCNGINIAMSCYTYEDHAGVNEKAPNGWLMTKEDAPLINAFDYTNLDLFYEEIQNNLSEMEEAGADAYILFIHWGDEYQLQQNSTQSAMAQKLCDLGVDVIIGGHPHVVQPVELLTSTLDETQKTVCLYSLGNAVSNQRLGYIDRIQTAHTEDGLLFSVTFAKYSDGTVILESATAIPTWVNMGIHPDSGRKEYNILPLDKAVEDWKTQFDLTDYTFSKANASYDRTMAIISEGMEEVNTYLSANQLQTEQSLGVE